MSLLLLLSPPSWYSNLLAMAKRFADEGLHEVAVVTAMMATETACENAFTQLFQLRGIADLEKPIRKLLPGYSLDNERVRKMYVALSKDQIDRQPFWKAFHEATELRGGLVHRGGRATPDQAREAVQAATELIDHIVATLARLRSGGSTP